MFRVSFILGYIADFDDCGTSRGDFWICSNHPLIVWVFVTVFHLSYGYCGGV